MRQWKNKAEWLVEMQDTAGTERLAEVMIGGETQGWLSDNGTIIDVAELAGLDAAKRMLQQKQDIRPIHVRIHWVDGREFGPFSLTVNLSATVDNPRQGAAAP